MNGSSTGVIPTFDISGNNGNNGWGGSMGEWIIGLVALGMLGNGGLFGGFGGGYGGMMYEFPWLLTGQNGINNNVNDGFDNLHLSNQIEGTRDAVNTLANSLCTSTASINSNIANGFYNSEISANNRAINQMQDTFALSRQFADCCCENRLGIANLNSTILSENCADRAALQEGVRDIITNDTNNTRAILDKLCQLELDGVKSQVEAKNDKIADLQRELAMKDLQASQIAQNAFISQGFANEVDQLYNRLSNCPVPSTPVYGRTPIFTCPNNNGCGCNGYNNLI